jgi:hypothetical protein
MSNYSFSNTLDGLNNIDANDINTDNISTDYLTVNKNSSVPLVTPYDTSSNQIASCAFVQDAFTNNLLDYAKLNPTSPQTFTGSTNTFSSTTNFNGAVNQNINSFHNVVQYYVSNGGNGTQSRITQTNSGIEVVNMAVSQSVILQSRTSTGTIVAGVQCQNGNTAYLQGNANNRITVIGSNTPTISTQAPALSNDLISFPPHLTTLGGRTSTANLFLRWASVNSATIIPAV